MNRWPFYPSFLLLIAFCSPAQADKKVTLLTGEYLAPYVFQKKNAFDGINVQIIHEILEKMDVEFELLQVPRARAIKLIETGKADGLLTTLPFDTQRLEHFWMSEELYSTSLSLITRSDDILTMEDFARRGNLILAKVRGANPLVPRERDVVVNSVEVLFSLLQIGRVDGVLAEEILFYNAVHKNKYFQKVKIAQKVTPKSVRFALSKHSPWLDKFTSEFNLALAEIRQKDRIDAIFITHLSVNNPTPDTRAEKR